MDAPAVLLIAVGLAMDAFAVSLCKGLASPGSKVRPALVAGIWFGAFQFVMPVVGYLLGSSVRDVVDDYDHWVAFGLLAAIGLNMVRESFSEEEDVDGRLDAPTMLLLAVATSIDALAVGISMSMTGDGILGPAAVIGAVAFAISALGVMIGGRVGARYGPVAERAGGAILVLIGLKVLLEGIGVLRPSPF